ncbi:MAG: glucose-1-phosphate adenylyltransferase [Propionibacteriaceae bacterium]|jgi:glucose-1-phosphate adenylyltransferase|nr:glucose-1-phosphate adenylyltransferase [Propionibacteriaceae bacterium]
MANSQVLSIVLAGGEGKRLMPLTADRAKPAVPFGGTYRLIDFVLSNLINSGLRRIAVLTQYKSHSLDRHISMFWQLTQMFGEYVASVPAQQRRGPHWYQGSADAIFQSLNLVTDANPDYVVVFGADNIYRMDISQMLAAHIASGAAATVAGIRVPRSAASSLGVIEPDPADAHRIKAFLEKPSDPPGLADSPDECLASMGNYIFTRKAFEELLHRDAASVTSKHDMGGDIIPAFVDAGEAAVYDFRDNNVPGATERDRNYWRDVGTMAAFHEAHMDLVSVVPEFNLYNSSWPIFTQQVQLPGAKFTIGGNAEDSIVAAGCIVSGAEVDRSVLSPGVRVEPRSRLDRTVVFENTFIGLGCNIANTIIDKYSHIADGTQLGFDPEYDKSRGCCVVDGITVVPKGSHIAP